MRRRTKLFALGVLVVVGLLLALGALPSYLRSGDPYYLTATPVTDHEAVNVSDLDERRYPYTTAALADAGANESGTSEPYWKGYVGLKEAFTHSPFDEVRALQGRSVGASEGRNTVFVRVNGSYYRLTVTQRR